MYENILQQKEAIKYEQKMIEKRNQDLQNQKLLEEEEAKRALLDKFDKTQNSMLGERRPTIKDSLNDTEPKNDKKRKLDDVDEEGKSELQKTVLELKKEREEAAKPKLGSFWVVMATLFFYARYFLLIKLLALCDPKCRSCCNYTCENTSTMYCYRKHTPFDNKIAN